MAASTLVIWLCAFQTLGWCLSCFYCSKGVTFVVDCVKCVPIPIKKTGWPTPMGSWKLNDPPLIKDKKLMAHVLSAPPPPPQYFLTSPLCERGDEMLRAAWGVLFDLLVVTAQRAIPCLPVRTFWQLDFYLFFSQRSHGLGFWNQWRKDDDTSFVNYAVARVSYKQQQKE